MNGLNTNHTNIAICVDCTTGLRTVAGSNIYHRHTMITAGPIAYNLAGAANITTLIAGT